MWYIVNEGPYETTVEDETTGRQRVKTRYELTVQDKTNLTLNAKTMNALYNALDANEFTRVKDCKSTKEIWNKLKKIHESSDNVRE